MTLRQKLISRNGVSAQSEEPLVVPAVGRIDRTTVVRIEALALAGHAGDAIARDRLYFALQARLQRIGWVLRPWPNTPAQTGLWDRDDVNQECWIVFVDLLGAWNTTVPFVPYLLARFAWRLRDRILRGIGKPQSQLGSIRIPEFLLSDLLYADDGEQPESAFQAQTFLEELIRQRSTGASTSAEFEAWLRTMYADDSVALTSPDSQHRRTRRAGLRRVS